MVLQSWLSRAWDGIAPAAPPGASKLEQEIAWRRKVASIIILLTIIVPASTAFIGKNGSQFVIMLMIVTCIDVFALYLNRQGRMFIAGIIVTTTTTVGLSLGVFGASHQPGGLTAASLTTLDLMVFSEVVAICLLPPISIWFVCIYNMIFCALVLSPLDIFMKSTQLHETLVQRGFFLVYETPATIYILFAIFTFIWSRTTSKAIRDAYASDAQANLNHALAEQKQQEQLRLQNGVHRIMQAISGISNNPQVSIIPPFQAEPYEQQILHALETLRRRLVREKLDAAEQEQLKQGLLQLHNVLSQPQAVQIQMLGRWRNTHPTVDLLALKIYQSLKIPFQSSPAQSFSPPQRW